MTTKLLVHPGTAKNLKLLLSNPPQSLIIHGPLGSGKKTLAEYIAAKVLNLGPNTKISSYPHFIHIQTPAGKQEIPISMIREIRQSLTLKTVGQNSLRRAVLIENANYLSIEAQNALLKMLEEPNADTIFILTTPELLSLLPTITSRCQMIKVMPVTLADAINYFQGKFSEKQITNAWQLSGGTAGLLSALLEDKSHPLKQAIDEAKIILKMPAYQRLIRLNEVGNKREELALILEGLNKILTALNHSAITKNSQKQSSLLTARKNVKALQQAVIFNANNKLVAASLSLKLRDLL